MMELVAKPLIQIGQSLGHYRLEVRADDNLPGIRSLYPWRRLVAIGRGAGGARVGGDAAELSRGLRHGPHVAVGESALFRASIYVQCAAESGDRR